MSSEYSHRAVEGYDSNAPLELGGVLVAVARALRTSAEDAHGGPVRIEHVHGRPEVVEYERRLPVRVRRA